MSRAAWVLKVLLSHWWRHPILLATLLIGLMSATALFSGVQAINAQARASYDRAAAAFGGSSTAMLVPAQETTVPQALFGELRRAGWLVSPVVEGNLRLRGKQVRLIGIEPISLPQGAGPAPNVDQSMLQGFLGPRGQVLIAPETARDLSVSEGTASPTSAHSRDVSAEALAKAEGGNPGAKETSADCLVKTGSPQAKQEFGRPPRGRAAEGDCPSTSPSDSGVTEGAVLTTESGEALPPLHITADLVPDLLVTDIGWAQRILHKGDRISRFLIDSRPSGERLPLQQVAGDSLRYVEAGAETDLRRLTASFHLNLTAFGLLSFLVGLFIVHSATGLAFEQRLPMFRTLRACGVGAGELTVILLVELVLLALLAGAAGVVAGYLIAAALLPDVAASLRGLYGASLSGQLAITPQWWLAGLAMSVAGALAAAAHALIKVLRLPLLMSAKAFAWQEAQQRWLLWQGALACVAFAVAAFEFWFGTSLIDGFAVLAGVLLGAALLLPVVLGWILGLGARLFSRAPIAGWAWADSRQQLSGFSLALMALLLALSVNVGVGTMVGSFSTTFLRWLDGRLAAEIYLAPKDDAQGAEIEAWLRGRPEVKAILPGVRVDTRVADEPVELFGLADHATIREQWPLLESSPDVWDRVRDGAAVLVSEQLSRRLKLRLGDTVRIPAPSGPWIATVAGTYADYGNPRGQIAVNVDLLRRRFPDAGPVRFGLRVAPSDVPALMTELQSRYSLGDRNLADQTTIKTESRRIFARTFAVTSALNAFTLAVAGVALLTSLLTLGQARLPQLAPLWAMGLTRRHLAALEFVKTMGLALLTALLALPLGIVVAWCLIEVVNVKAFGWRLPLEVFPMDLARLLLVAMLAAALAILLPMLKLARTQPITLLKIFADER